MEIAGLGFFSCDPPPASDDVDRLTVPTWPYSKQFFPISLNLEEVDRLQRAYWNTLVEYIPRSGWRPPRNGKLTILDLGCGSAFYAIPAKAYFGRNKHYRQDQNSDVRYIGVDWSADGIKLAKNNFPGRPDYIFIEGDARDLKKYSRIPDQVDLIIMRHFPSSNVWQQVVIAGRDKLKPGGLIIFSTYMKGERDGELDLLESVPGLKVIISEKNPHSSCGENSGYCEDNYVIIAKKVSR